MRFVEVKAGAVEGYILQPTFCFASLKAGAVCYAHITRAHTHSSLTHTHPGMYVDAARYDMMLLLLPRVESVHVWDQRDGQGLSRVARYAECVLYRMCSLWNCDAQDIRIDAYARPFRVAAVAGFDSCYLSLPPSFPPPLPPELSPCA